MRNFVYYLFVICLFSTFCTENQEKNLLKKPHINIEETLIKINRQLVKENVEKMKNFAKEKKWNMQSTERGAMFEIYKMTKNQLIRSGNVVHFKYSLSLLDGTFCYSSDSLGIKTIKLGQGNAEAGLEEVFEKLCEGEKAHIIIPPYLAYGTSGDNNKIPPLAMLVYDVEIVKVE